MTTKLQIMIDLHVQNIEHKTEVLSSLLNATKKFEESIPSKVFAELSQIVIPNTKNSKLEPSIEYGQVYMNLVSQQVKVNNTEIVLTQTEFKLLSILLERHGYIQDRKTLLQEVWQANPNNNTRTVDVYIKRLRAKLGINIIQTVSGVGYVIK